jgi:AraC family transcriptional activator of pobA
MLAEHVLESGEELGANRLRNELLGLSLRYSKHDAVANIATSASRHQQHELIYIEDGERTQRIGSDLVRTRPGDVFLLAPETFHRHADPAHWSAWSLRFRLDGLELGANRFEFLAKTASHRFSVPENERARWEARFHYLLSELNDDIVPRPRLISNIVRSIFVDAQRLLHGDTDIETEGRRPLLDRVFGFIDAHYMESIGLQDVARAVHFSAAYLTDLVRRETGRPIHQWIGQRRLGAARLLLAETDLSIAAIAEHVGFRDATYFGRHFAKLTGQTPRAFREMCRRRDRLSSEANGWGATTACGALGDYVHLRGLGECLTRLQTREEIEEAVLKATHETLGPSLTQILWRDKARGVSTVSRQLGSRHFSLFPSSRDVDGAIPLVVEGQTVIANDLTRSPLELHRRISSLGYSSLLIAPIMIGTDFLGAIRVLERKVRAFSEHERTLLAMIGTLTGLALRGLSPLEAHGDVCSADGHRRLRRVASQSTVLSQESRASTICSHQGAATVNAAK